MAQSIRELMTADLRTVAPDATVSDAARALAEGRDRNATPVREIATMDVVTLTVDQTVEEAIRLGREHDVRRIPVVQDGGPAGVVTLGDHAIERDTGSALADITSELANN